MGVLQDASRFVIALDIMFFLLLGMSLLLVEPGSDSYYAALLTLVPTTLTFVAAVAVLYTDWEPF